MTEGLLLRRLSIADLPVFKSLRLEGLRECPESFAEDAEAFESRSVEEITAQFVASSEAGAYIASAWNGDKLIAVCGVRPERHKKINHRAVLWGVYVRQEFRGRGVGHHLVRYALGETTSQTLQIKLCVTTSNLVALRLYLKLGFRIVGLDPRVVRIGETYFDEYEMIYDKTEFITPQVDSKDHVYIRGLRATDIESMHSAFTALGLNRPRAQFERYLDEQSRGLRSVLLALPEEIFAGYVTISWMRYPPELQDLNVLPQFRRRGIGSELLSRAETLAKTRSACITLQVGLTADYGPAQKLYLKRGYITEGDGLKYKDRSIEYGEYVKADDDLTLRLSKLLA
jgi:ribosomal protein S18 acetylase RimI-like enzyme